ncbi:hypothetical protein llap_14061 [Limosa lapponica baueri]|uniref:Uncharacterized protein n=1 Tax=Limosa lapponica baueri TaxID=1758121 RepID=A0A2I0TPE3_LIMLA|nr:hypothetical protein llap_14061 [Limosa lapponica baueri]
MQVVLTLQDEETSSPHSAFSKPKVARDQRDGSWCFHETWYRAFWWWSEGDFTHWAEPGKRGGKAVGGCLHNPRTLEKSQGTPVEVKQPVKLAFSKDQYSHLGTCCDEGRRKDGGRKGREYKDGDGFYALKELRIVVPPSGVKC